MFLVFVIFNLLFSVYFFKIGLWYLSALPVLFTVFIVISIASLNPAKFFDKNKFIESFMMNLYYIAWWFIMFGVVGIFGQFSFFWLNFFSISLYLIIINIFLRLFSYLVGFRDWQKVFQFWYFFSIFLCITSLILNIFGVTKLNNLDLVRTPEWNFMQLQSGTFVAVNEWEEVEQANGKKIKVRKNKSNLLLEWSYIKIKNGDYLQYSNWELKKQSTAAYFSYYDLIDAVMYFILLTFGVYAFINFVVSSFMNIDDNIKYRMFLFLNFSVMILIYIFSNRDLYTSILLSQVYLTLIFVLIYFSKKFAIKEEDAPAFEEKPTLEDILSRKKRITQKHREKGKYYIVYEYLTKLDKFFWTMPNVMKFVYWIANVVLIFVQITLFIIHIYSNPWNTVFYYEILYWVGIILFFMNFIFLQYIDYYYYIQRIFVFFVINFGIYLSVINLFGGSELMWDKYLYITIIWIVWNILNNFAIFASSPLKEKKFLYTEDYYLWILSNFWALLVNIYFIFRLSILWWSIFFKLSLSLLYVWIQLFLTFYNIKFIKRN